MDVKDISSQGRLFSFGTVWNNGKCSKIKFNKKLEAVQRTNWIFVGIWTWHWIPFAGRAEISFVFISWSLLAHHRLYIHPDSSSNFNCFCFFRSSRFGAAASSPSSSSGHTTVLWGTWRHNSPLITGSDFQLSAAPYQYLHNPPPICRCVRVSERASEWVERRESFWKIFTMHLLEAVKYFTLFEGDVGNS